MTRGRKSEYTEKMGERICDLVATHAWSLKNICAHYKDLPDDTTIFQWRLRHPDFGRDYAKAKQIQAEKLVEEILDISDDKSNDVLYDKEGKEHCNTEFVARSRLRVDSRKWIASKLAPKIYGDRQIIEQTTTENERLKEELAALRAQLAEKSKAEY